MGRAGFYGARTEVKKEKIESHEVTFAVNEDGTWFAESAILDNAIAGKSLQEVTTKIRATLRRAVMKLAIKATLVNTLPESEVEKDWYNRDDSKRANMIRPITLTGISPRHGEVLYTFDDSGRKTKKKNSHQSNADPDSIGIVCRRLTKAEEKEYRTLRDAFDDSRSALEAWIRNHRIENVTTFMEEQIQSRIDAEPAVEEPETDPRESAPTRKPGRRRG